LRLATQRSLARGRKEDLVELERLREEEPWIDGWALWCALTRAHHGASWVDWPEPLRKRDHAALARARRDHAQEIAVHEHAQLWFRRQWRRLREHCRRHGVALLGDVPMFVAHDSADVWCNPELFYLDEAGRSTVVAGVPPDAFSETGQLWGNPLYRWERMQERGFGWWLERLGVTLARFDAVRLDHFIGFRRYWEIAAGAEDARVGRFVRVPGEQLFEAARNAFGALPFVAEDLGILTDEVHALRDRFELPGMRVLQFAFGSDDHNDYQPHRYVRNTVVYTGTHDNDTTAGWFEKAPESERTRVMRYLGCDGRNIHWDMIRTALSSVANLAIFPLQDALGLGSGARMNTPATVTDNWSWRVRADQLTPELAESLRALSGLYERTPRVHAGDGAAFTGR
jgi:4-alpha-glucanotransferase